MQLSAPKQYTFLVAVVLVLLSIISTFVTIPIVSANAFWLVVVGFIILAAGNMIDGF
jgi:heme/copper-type cytochrome/quinol oxidase subunit 1